MAVCTVMEFAGMDAPQYEALMDVLELGGVNPAWHKPFRKATAQVA